MALRHHRELVTWQKAVDLAVAAYGVTKFFPREELYGLTSQVRRAAVSVPSNIAEGQGRGAPDDFKRFLRISNGSRQELETQVLVAERLAYISPPMAADIIALSEEVGRLNSGLIRSL